MWWRIAGAVVAFFPRLFGGARRTLHRCVSLSVLTTVIVGLILSVSAGLIVTYLEDQSIDAEFVGLANTRRQLLHDGLNKYVDQLAALRAFFEATDRDIGRREFETSGSAILGPEPAIENIAWIPRVSRDQRAAIELAAAGEGIKGYRISSVAADGTLVRSPERDEYFPILYSTAERDSPIYGLDLGSEPMRAGVLAESRDGDRMVASKVIRLRSDAEGRNGFFLVAPIYRPGSAHLTVEDRRRNLIGFMQMTFRLGELVEAILRGVHSPRGLDIYFYADGTSPGAMPLYVRSSQLRTQPAEPRSRRDVEAGWHWSGKLEIAGSQLIMVVVPLRGSPLTVAPGRGWIVSAVGVVLTLWSILYLARMRYREAILSAVSESAAELIPATSLDAAMPKVLKLVGETIDADRLRIVEIVPGTAGASRLFDSYIWNSPGATPALPPNSLKDPPEGAVEFAEWLSMRGMAVSVLLPRIVQGRMGRMLSKLGVKSGLWVPIEVEGRLWGYLGAHECHAERRWQSSETSALTLLAGLIGGAINRVRVLAVLQEANGIVENSTTILYRCAGTPAMPLTYISSGVVRLGYDPKELVAEPEFYHSIVHPEDQDRLHESQRRVFEEGLQSESLQFRIRTRGGEWRWFENRVSAIRDDSGRLLSVEGILFDITAFKEVENKLAFANILLTTAQENSPDGTLVVDAKARILTFNRRFADLMRLPNTVVAGQADEPVLKAVVGQMKDPEMFLARVRFLYEHPEIGSRDEIELKDGRIFDRDSRSLYDASQNYLGRIWFFRDITERKQEERMLNQQNTLLHALNESVGQLVTTATLADVVPKALEKIGTALRGDRLIVVELQRGSDGRRRSIIRYEWHASNRLIDPIAELLGEASPDLPDVAAWYAPLESGRTVVVTRETANATVKAILDQCKLATILLVPIISDGRFWGILGIDDANPERQWPAREIDILMSLAALVGAAISRERHTAIVAQADTIIRHSPAILYRADGEPPMPLTYVSPNIAQLGIDPLALLEAPNSYRGYIHPDDRAAVDAILRQMTDPNSGAATFEFRVRTGDGSYCWVENHCMPIRDANGRLVEIEGIMANISERKAAEDARKQAHDQMQSTVEVLERHGREMAAIGKLNDLLQACSSRDDAYPIIAAAGAELFPGTNGALALVTTGTGALETVLQWGSDQVVRPEFTLEECWALRVGRVHEVNIAGQGAQCRHFNSPPRGAYECFPLVVRGETTGLLHVNLAPGAGIDDDMRRLMSTFGDVIKLSLSNLRLHETLRDQALRDHLTGLFNRHYLAETLPREVHRARRHGVALSVAMIDIDHFKSFNDLHGHDAGDEVLRELAVIFGEATRANDIACRYGGEEFLLILTDCDLSDAHLRLEQICLRVKQKRFSYKGTTLPAVTISVGLSQLGEELTSAEELITAADQALYVAKKSGRDRIEHYSREARRTDSKPTAIESAVGIR